MDVRYAEQQDIDWLGTVDQWPRWEDWSLKIAGRLAYIAEEAGERAGHARLDVLWSTVPFPAMSAMQPAFRGRGLSRPLLQFIEADLAARGYITLLSSAQTDEPEPQQWHTAMGFTSNGIIEHIADGNIGELVYGKPLRNPAE
jgi:GNAT superfamily N-acetyltransferase